MDGTTGAAAMRSGKGTPRIRSSTLPTCTVPWVVRGTRPWRSPSTPTGHSATSTEPMGVAKVLFAPGGKLDRRKRLRRRRPA